MALDLIQAAYNPDVLSCLANLSNDEVFTPPEVVNQMLDMLPQELFSNPDTTFLDPATKSGVFLREIAKRLMVGLEKQIPDVQERVDHIFKKQLFGIAMTELTSLLSRRSLYCSKYPNSNFSVTRFDSPEGNIRFHRIQHTWEDGKCVFCSVSRKSVLGNDERGKSLESHAYEWIHTIKPEECFNMKFDVIISNPPYQVSTAGSVESQALPIYHKFISQAKKLQPRYLSMIIPSRWMNGGFGLDDFRKEMLSDKHIRVLHDFLNADDVFAGISLTGGACYFLWDKEHEGKCDVYTHSDGGNVTESERYLLEDGLDTFIRLNEALSILNKVRSKGEQSFSDIVSQRDPFGLNYFENGHENMFKKMTLTKQHGDCPIYSFGWQKNGISYTSPNYITDNKAAFGKHKVFISKANGAASTKIPYAVLSKPFVAGPNTICNMTYLLVGPFENETTATNAALYITTKFFRFLVSLLKNTQNAYKKVYTFVPMQDFSEQWTDEKLYDKYGFSSKEIDYIESMIKEMNMDGGEE